MYVLRRTTGGYVSAHGPESYTSDLQKAKIYPDRKAAVADSCPENETPMPYPYPEVTR